MKESRITIKCSDHTVRLWRKYVALSDSNDFEEALIKLLKESGWLSRVRAAEALQKDII